MAPTWIWIWIMARSCVGAQDLSDADLHSRTVGVDLPREIALELFRSYVPQSSCKPDMLFVVNIPAGKGTATASWSAMKKAFAFLSAILDAPRGRLPHHQSWHDYFVEWLGEGGTVWPRKKSEAVITNLHAMIQAIMRARRKMIKGEKPPKAFGELIVLAASGP